MQTYLASNKRPSDLADDDLVQQAQTGDPGAFEILFERYSALLFLLISRIVRDEHLAHDVLQHVFLQLYRSLPTLVPGGTLKAWLSQVARHGSIDELRRRRHPLFSEIEPFPDEGEYSLLATLSDPDLQPEEQVELCELRLRLLEAIETLPPNFRAVERLRYATHLSFREIGQALGIPAATAKTYFYRATELLRASLKPEFEHAVETNNSGKHQVPLSEASVRVASHCSRKEKLLRNRKIVGRSAVMFFCRIPASRRRCAVVGVST